MGHVLLVASVPALILVWYEVDAWRSAPRRTHKELAEGMEREGISIVEPSRAELEAGLTRRRRWAAVAIGPGLMVASSMAGMLNDEVGFSWLITAYALAFTCYALGGMAATCREATATSATRRVAGLRPRDLGHYLPAFERVSQRVWLCVFVGATGVGGIWLVAGRPTYEAFVLLVIGVLGLAVSAVTAATQRVALRVPLRASDDDSRRVHDLLVSFTLHDAYRSVAAFGAVVCWSAAFADSVDAHPFVLGGLAVTAMVVLVISITRSKTTPWHLYRHETAAA